MRGKRWTPEEEQYLVENYKSMSDEGMARELGRTRDGVHFRRNLLGLYKRDPGGGWTGKDNETFTAMALEGYTNQEIADQLGRSYPAIAVKLYNQSDDFKEMVAIKREERKELLESEGVKPRRRRRSKKREPRTTSNLQKGRLLTKKEKGVVRMALLSRLSRCGSRRLCDCVHCQEGQRITSVYDLKTREEVDEWFKENEIFLME